MFKLYDYYLKSLGLRDRIISRQGNLLLLTLFNRRNCLLTVLSLLMFMGACGLTARTKALIKGDIKVSVNIDPEANQNNPLSVDLVLVFDEDLLKTLLNYSASTWFEKREQIKRDFPKDKGLQVWNWEWTPGQRITLKKVPMVGRAKGGLIFAQYFSKGDHRARFDPFANVHIDFFKDTFKITEP